MWLRKSKRFHKSFMRVYYIIDKTGSWNESLNEYGMRHHAGNASVGTYFFMRVHAYNDFGWPVE